MSDGDILAEVSTDWGIMTIRDGKRPVEPITLYRPTTSREGHIPVGKFVERAWCATDNLPMVEGENHCYGWHPDLTGFSHMDCVPEPLPRLVQEPPQ